VQPYYVFDESRAGAVQELRTMAAIRKAIGEMSPEAGALVRPSVIRARHDIPPAGEITRQFRRLEAQSFIGSQHDWLARFALQEGIKGLELSVHADDNIATHLAGHVRPDGDGWVLSEDALETPLAILRNYRFPLLQMTKQKMGGVALKRGYRDILEMSWFCHDPLLGRPCGFCNPCRYALAEGMGYRIHPVLRTSMYRFIRRAAGTARKHAWAVASGLLARLVGKSHARRP